MSESERKQLVLHAGGRGAETGTELTARDSSPKGAEIEDAFSNLLNSPIGQRLREIMKSKRGEMEVLKRKISDLEADARAFKVEENHMFLYSFSHGISTLRKELNSTAAQSTSGELELDPVLSQSWERDLFELIKKHLVKVYEADDFEGGTSVTLGESLERLMDSSEFQEAVIDFMSKQKVSPENLAKPGFKNFCMGYLTFLMKRSLESHHGKESGEEYTDDQIEWLFPSSMSVQFAPHHKTEVFKNGGLILAGARSVEQILSRPLLVPGSYYQTGEDANKRIEIQPAKATDHTRKLVEIVMKHFLEGVPREVFLEEDEADSAIRTLWEEKEKTKLNGLASRIRGIESDPHSPQGLEAKLRMLSLEYPEAKAPREELEPLKRQLAKLQEEVEARIQFTLERYSEAKPAIAACAQADMDAMILEDESVDFKKFEEKLLTFLATCKDLCLIILPYYDLGTTLLYKEWLTLEPEAPKKGFFDWVPHVMGKASAHDRHERLVKKFGKREDDPEVPDARHIWELMKTALEVHQMGTALKKAGKGQESIEGNAESFLLLGYSIKELVQFFLPLLQTSLAVNKVLQNHGSISDKLGAFVEGLEAFARQPLDKTLTELTEKFGNRLAAELEVERLGDKKKK